MYLIYDTPQVYMCICDLLLQIDDFSKSSLGLKPFWGSNFLDFLLPKNSPHMGHLIGVKNFDISMSSMWYQWCTHHLKSSKLKPNCESQISMRHIMWKVVWLSIRCWIVFYSIQQISDTPSHKLPLCGIPPAHHLPYRVYQFLSFFFYKKSLEIEFCIFFYKKSSEIQFFSFFL